MKFAARDLRDSHAAILPTTKGVRFAKGVRSPRSWSSYHRGIPFGIF